MYIFTQPLRMYQQWFNTRFLSTVITHQLQETLTVQCDMHTVHLHRHVVCHGKQKTLLKHLSMHENMSKPKITILSRYFLVVSNFLCFVSSYSLRVRWLQSGTVCLLVFAHGTDLIYVLSYFWTNMKTSFSMVNICYIITSVFRNNITD